MAKRRKKEEEEEEEGFEMPEFDREEYMRDEIKKGKTTLVAVGLAPLFSIVSFYVFSVTEEWTVGLFAGLLGVIFLKPIYNTLDLDVDVLGTKGWAKNFGVYVLTLFAVWIVLMNPPFGDFADPRVNELEVEIREGEVFDIEDAEVVENITEELDEGNYTRLSQEYQKNGYNLSQEVKVSVVEEGREWFLEELLEDDEKGYEHEITYDYENETLSIYGRELVRFDRISMEEALARTYNVTFRARVTSNTEIKEDTVSITLEYGDTTIEEDMRKEPERDHYYWMTYDIAASRDPIDITIEMEDTGGNSNSVEFQVYIPDQE